MIQIPVPIFPASLPRACHIVGQDGRQKMSDAYSFSFSSKYCRLSFVANSISFFGVFYDLF
jgi:hypothetical protein